MVACALLRGEAGIWQSLSAGRRVGLAGDGHRQPAIRTAIRPGVVWFACVKAGPAAALRSFPKPWTVQPCALLPASPQCGLGVPQPGLEKSVGAE